MRSTIYEVDEDVYQITTEHEDGHVTVETVFGRDAYEAHMQREVSENGQRAEHTLAGQFYDASYAARRVAARGNQEVLRH